ncbi:MAG: alpha/beta hydrolase [Acidobacteria bacterium]|jgi:acetyl esterase/lipase|nr:alpha/beta hydrolase [Acidobacteriota bacterium]
MRHWPLFALPALCLFACSPPDRAALADTPAAPAPVERSQEELTWTTGAWEAPEGLTQLPIWPGAAPGVDAASSPPERVATRYSPEAVGGDTSQAIFDVSDPTITIYPPKGANTGAAVIVFPGGGFNAVVVTLEGTEICDWVTSHGMTCILSKYRVPNTNHSWNKECQCVVEPNPAPALQDAQRTVRMVRAMAPELGIDPAKVGAMGFSAGGYLTVQLSNISEPEYPLTDRIDAFSSRPDFAISFFAGHICRAGDKLDPRLKITEKTPPTFLIQAWDDDVNPVCNATVYARALDAAGVPAEVHLFATGGHAFGLRRDHSPDTVWPSLLEHWLRERGVLP